MRVLLFALILTACVPVRGSRIANAYPLPATVHTAGGPIPVVLVDSLPATDSSFFVVGRFNYADRRIYVLARVTSPLQRWRIVQHERCHVILLESGLHNLTESTFRELLCDAYAEDRVAELVRGKP